MHGTAEDRVPAADVLSQLPVGAAPLSGAPARQRVRVDSPASLLAVVPALLGFQPAGSFVIIASLPPRGTVKLTLRYDLPGPGGCLAVKIAAHAAEVLSDQDLTTVAAVGYGADEAVTPIATAFADCAARAGLRIGELLRAHDGRYWSYLCENPACCPPGGKPYDPAAAPAAAVIADRARILASRDELAASVADPGGQEAEDMIRETAVAEERADGLAGRAIGLAGAVAVSAAIDAARRGDDDLACDSAAWLTVVLRNQRTRDNAVAVMDPAHRAAHVRLWTRLTRLARPGYVAAPATLLALVAWQSGNGALANVALDRAEHDDPAYSMAQLMRNLVTSGMPPGSLPMIPAEVAASYDQRRR